DTDRRSLPLDVNVEDGLVRPRQLRQRLDAAGALHRGYDSIYAGKPPRQAHERSAPTTVEESGRADAPVGYDPGLVRLARWRRGKIRDEEAPAAIRPHRDDHADYARRLSAPDGEPDPHCDRRNS